VVIDEADLALAPLTSGKLGVDVERSVATITFQRAEKRNALTIPMWRELTELVEWVGHRPDIRVLVVEGGGVSFCAGADIGTWSEGGEGMAEAVADAERTLREVPIPTIAKIRGHCMGGGVQIAVACDIRVCDGSAVFSVPPAKMGIVYHATSIRTLVALVGPGQASRLLFTAARIDADEARSIRLVETVVTATELDDHVREMSDALLAASPLTQASAKETINALVDGADASAAQEIFDQWVGEWTSSVDRLEGPRAFLERRAPAFTWARRS
jgi:enoyl-CoA hydratase/carnithine racemase